MTITLTRSETAELTGRLRRGAQAAYERLTGASPAAAWDTETELSALAHGGAVSLWADAALLDALCARGYEPQDDVCEQSVSVLCGAQGAVRVVVRDDGASVTALDRDEIPLWQARFDPTAPVPVVLSVMDTAEEMTR